MFSSKIVEANYVYEHPKDTKKEQTKTNMKQL